MTEVVEILNDAALEGPDSFTLTVTSPNGGASLGSPTTATINIADNEPVVEWSAVSFAGKEPVGAAATAVANLSLKRTGSLVGDVTVDVRAVVDAGPGKADFGPAPPSTSSGAPTRRPSSSRAASRW